ncbi:HEAT repeat protein [Streptomyces puniciscabiei]|uniref:HEAT repeat protein n=1 Tax=Streptomyces puniciscabiei TaxID=164348 RepID=A0A542TIQ2_9ACTN|nr:HEAT repeat domain-containing protein [Streptomyces puniciscabiei]TQK86587.1 HEAT repeat protein [Streptomyces puniciscabiei]
MVAHRDAPDPAHRRLLLDYLGTRALLRTDPGPYEKRECEFLASWAAEEQDGATLAKLLDAFMYYDDPAVVSLALRHIAHPDARVRRAVAYALPSGGPPSPEVAAARLALLRDPDTEVRTSACAGLRHAAVLTRECVRELILRTGDPDPGVREEAAAALAQSADRSPDVAAALRVQSGGDDLRRRRRRQQATG